MTIHGYAETSIHSCMSMQKNLSGRDEIKLMVYSMVNIILGRGSLCGAGPNASNVYISLKNNFVCPKFLSLINMEHVHAEG